jgi:L-alanine-DL-glutamate epimerase-like enolase superfamily enzyme
LRIEAVTTQLARLPLLGGSWSDQIRNVSHIETIVTDVVADSGLVGTGFAYTSGIGGTAVRALIEAELAPFVTGKEASPRGRWHEAWMHVHDMGGGGVSTMALATIDIALWDLLAKQAGMALVELLGRCRQRIPAYASGINLQKSEDELLEQVRRWKAEGYRAFKVKVGRPEIEEDVERLRRVKEITGRLPLMVDANQGWDFAKAARAITAFEPLALHWVEEPLLSDDVEGHARLRRLVRTPIASGETVCTLQQFKDYLSRGACDFVQADIVRVGGITPYLEIAALARAFGIPIAPHFVMELSGQVLCSLPNAHILEAIEGGSFSELNALVEPMPVVDGWFTPPSVPGHGIEFDREYLKRHAVA